MEKKLHATSSFNQSARLPQPHYTLQQTLMEDEYSAELALVQQHRLMPRAEAVDRLLDLIARQSVAEEQH